MTDSRHPLSPPPAPEAAPSAYGDVRRLLPQLPGRTAALLLTGLVGACNVPAQPGEPQPGSGEPIAVPVYGLPEPEVAAGSGSGASVGEGSQGPANGEASSATSQPHDGEGANEGTSPLPGDGSQPGKPDEVRRPPPAPLYGLPPGNVQPDPVPRHPPPVQPYGAPPRFRNPPPPQPPPVQPYGVPIPPPEPPLVPEPVPPPTESSGAPSGGLGDLPPLPPLEGSGADPATTPPSTGAYGGPPALRSTQP